MVKLCVLCAKNRAILKRPKTGQQICQPCFFYVFETEIHHTIVDTKLFERGERVAIGASGGKGKSLYVPPYPPSFPSLTHKCTRN
jgi:cytoplasmic tRNA 2-thiolation protein 1